MPQPPVDPSAVRTWARAQGMQVGDRGRLPAAVLEGYLAAHPPRAPRARKTAAAVVPEQPVAPDLSPSDAPTTVSVTELGHLRDELEHLRSTQEELLRRVGMLEAGRRRMFRRA